MHTRQLVFTVSLSFLTELKGGPITDLLFRQRLNPDFLSFSKVAVQHASLRHFTESNAFEAVWQVRNINNQPLLNTIWGIRQCYHIHCSLH